MKNILDNPYEIIFDALISAGYSETEAETIICRVIEEQKEFDDIAIRIHQILEQNKVVH